MSPVLATSWARGISGFRSSHSPQQAVAQLEPQPAPFDLIAEVADLGKTTFYPVALGERNKVLVRKKFFRTQLLAYAANLLAETFDAKRVQENRGTTTRRTGARLPQGGDLWAAKNKAAVLADVTITVGLHEEKASHWLFGSPYQRSRVEPQRAAIEDSPTVEVFESIPLPEEVFPMNKTIQGSLQDFTITVL